MITWTQQRLGGSERGEILPFVILGAVFIMLIAGGVGMYRVAKAKGNVESIAQSGARWASIERSGATGKARAKQLINDSISDRGLDCTKTTAQVDT